MFCPVKLCGKCGGPTVQKALFTSLYDHCEPCENPKPKQSPDLLTVEYLVTINKWVPSVGEAVVCIVGSDDSLTVGKIYQVDSYNAVGYVGITKDDTGLRNVWDEKRFAPYKLTGA